jgi:hypothetical protein
MGFIHHLLHRQRSPTGSREEVLRAATSSACVALSSSQESSPRRLRPPSPFRGANHLLLASSPPASLSSQRSLQLTRAVQAEIIPVSINRRQPALLTELLAQEPREPSRTLARSTIDCDLHRRIWHHMLGIGVEASTRGHEIQRRLVGFGRSAGND